jgi:broad specificity phosphatase PhoE
VRLIVTSDLKRTRETAEIIARALGDVRIVVEPEFAERGLGEWNLRSIDSTQPWLELGWTPPGGESLPAFDGRIARAARRVLACLPERPLLVGSKGVGRVLGELSGLPERLDLGNAALVDFDLGDLCTGGRIRAGGCEVPPEVGESHDSSPLFSVSLVSLRAREAA